VDSGGGAAGGQQSEDQADQAETAKAMAIESAEKSGY